MARIEFAGARYVRNYHLSVPHHELELDKKKSLTAKPSLEDNLIIHGDNLKALKALLPHYAGKVKCIYIDPPYNTGNENWVYNDNVNSPRHKEWLGKVVDKDCQDRHDRWLSMMTPRLKLLRELLKDDGVIFISIDDNEVTNLRMLLDEIYGEENFVQQIIWKNKYGPGAMTKAFGNVHEYILAYSKTPIESITSTLTEEEMKKYKSQDEKFEIRGGYITQPLMTRSKDDRENLMYSIKYNGEEIKPDKQWIWEEKRLKKAIQNNEVVFNQDSETGKWSVRFKQYLKDENGKLRKGKPISVLNGPFNQEGTWEIESIFNDKTAFSNPKPVGLIKMFLNYEINGKSNSSDIVLDSFAGSGTTAQAVLALNKEDGGKRKFILVEQEEYADTITAERVRRVIKGVKTAKDENLQKGLGGSFTYATLGAEYDVAKILAGKSLPKYEDMAAYVFQTATGETLDKKKIDKKKNYIGSSKFYDVYLFYEADVEKLKGPDCALKLDFVEAFKGKGKKKRLVFGAVRYVNQETMTNYDVEFCQLPYEVYRRIEETA